MVAALPCRLPSGAFILLALLDMPVVRLSLFKEEGKVTHIYYRYFHLRYVKSREWYWINVGR